MKFLAISVACILTAFPAQASTASLKEAALDQLQKNCHRSAIFKSARCKDIKNQFDERVRERKKTGNPFSDAVAGLNDVVGELAAVGPQAASIAANVFNAPEKSIADTFATVIDSAGGLNAAVVDDKIQVKPNSAPSAECMNRGEDDVDDPSTTIETPEIALRAVIDKVFNEVVATATRKDQRLVKRSRFIKGLAILGSIAVALVGFAFAAFTIFSLIQLSSAAGGLTANACCAGTTLILCGSGCGVLGCWCTHDACKMGTASPPVGPQEENRPSSPHPQLENLPPAITEENGSSSPNPQEENSSSSVNPLPPNLRELPPGHAELV